MPNRNNGQRNGHKHNDAGGQFRWSSGGNAELAYRVWNAASDPVYVVQSIAEPEMFLMAGNPFDLAFFVELEHAQNVAAANEGVVQTMLYGAALAYCQEHSYRMVFVLPDGSFMEQVAHYVVSDDGNPGIKPG